MEIIFEDKMSNKILVSMVSILFLLGCAQKSEEDNGKEVPVKIFKVKSESISKYIRATGTVEADEDVILYSRITERVKAIYVTPGQSVMEDQILVEQKNDILKQGMEIAAASLKSAELQSKLTAIDFERMVKLYGENAISPQQFEKAKLAKETADNTLDQAKSLYEQAKDQYENSFIKAPFNGIVAAVYVEKNQTINMGQSVVQVISPTKMKAKVHITGEDVNSVKAGQRALIKFPIIKDKEYFGKVSRINIAVDQVTKSVEVEIVFLSKDENIKSGMFGEYYIEIQQHPDCLVIPEVALIPQTEIKIDRTTGLQSTLKKHFLYVIENNKAKMIEVKTGIADEGRVEITSGIKTGDSVIIIGQNIVKVGQTVIVTE